VGYNIWPVVSSRPEQEVEKDGVEDGTCNNFQIHTFEPIPHEEHVMRFGRKQSVVVELVQKTVQEGLPHPLHYGQGEIPLEE